MPTMQDKTGIIEVNLKDIKMQDSILPTKNDSNIDLVSQMTKTFSPLTTNEATSSTTSEKKTAQLIPESQQPQQQQQMQQTMQTPQIVPVRSSKRTANDYRFGKTIGEGSFSTVYLAKDIHTNKEVASMYK